MLELLSDIDIPETLISQYLPGSYAGVRAGTVAPKADALVVAAIDRVLADYYDACE